MSFSVINGKFKPRPVVSKAPSPAQIARLAYDRAVSVALRYHVGMDVSKLKAFMEKARDAELDELREEVVNPPAIRGKR